MQIQLKEILKSSPILHEPEDLLKYIDAIFEIARDDVARIARARKKYFADFDTAYQLSCKATKKTLSKRSLKAVKRILSCGKIEKTATWLVSRLLNNMLNLTTNNNYKEYVDFGNITYEDRFFEDQNLNFFETEDFLEKTSRVDLKLGLKVAFSNGTLDLNEAEYLCQKYNLNLTEILGYDPYETPEIGQEKAKSGNLQLTLLF